MQLQYLTLFLHLHLTLTSFTLKKCFSLWRPDTWSPQGQIFKVKYPYPCVGNVFLKTMCIIILLYCANTPFCHFQTLFCYEKQCLNCTSMRVPSPGNTMYFLFVLSVCVCACVGVCCIWVEIEEQTHIPRPLSWHREHGVSFDLQIHLQMKGFWAKACRRGGRVSARCARSKQASACVCFFFSCEAETEMHFFYTFSHVAAGFGPLGTPIQKISDEKISCSERNVIPRPFPQHVEGVEERK